MDSKMDRFGARGILGSGETKAIPIRATEQGDLCVSESGTLVDVIRVDLSAPREKERIYNGAFTELTFARVPAVVQVCFAGGQDGKYVTIEGQTSIGAIGNELWISHAAVGGTAEIWIWR